MDLAIGVVMLILGISTVMKKEVKLSKDRVTRGNRAVLAGVLLILALPLMFVAGYVELMVSPRGMDVPLAYVVAIVLAVAVIVVVSTGAKGSAPAT